MYSSSYSMYGGGGGYPSALTSGFTASYTSIASPRTSRPRYRDYSSRYSNMSAYPTPMNYRNLMTPSRGDTVSRNLRIKSPSIPRERTRDELIDSIIHTRTKEHRVMPGFRSSSDYGERQSMKVDCDRVFNGIIIGNGETVLNIDYLKGIGVTHVLNTAEGHVPANPGKFSCYGIKYYGFHVDDLPGSNISRYFHRTTEFIHKAVESGGLIVVNCYMGWSRSATCVAAYLMMKHNMTATRAVETIRGSRPIRPNAGFLQQLADLENTLKKRISW